MKSEISEGKWKVFRRSVIFTKLKKRSENLLETWNQKLHSNSGQRKKTTNLKKLHKKLFNGDRPMSPQMEHDRGPSISEDKVRITTQTM